MNFLIFLGPPGCGKGTQARYLQKNASHIIHISTGNLLREEIDAGSEIGKKLQALVEQGAYVPDEIMLTILENNLAHCDKNATVVLDGFPRTIAQLDLLDVYIKKTGSSLKKVLYFHISDNFLVERLSGRMMCHNCGEIYHKVSKKPKVENICDVCSHSGFDIRKDDQPAVIQTRLEKYHQETTGIINRYTNLGFLEKVAADLPIQDVATRIEEYIR